LYGDFLTGTFFDRRIGPHYPGQGLPLSPAPVVLAGACAPQMRCICRFWQHFLGDNRLPPVVLLENAAEYSKCTRAFHLASTMATRCVWSFWHHSLGKHCTFPCQAPEKWHRLLQAYRSQSLGRDEIFFSHLMPARLDPDRCTRGQSFLIRFRVAPQRLTVPQSMAPRYTTTIHTTRCKVR
jgi:hypothetical protein